MQHRHYLLLDRVVIQGANAISSPLTYGFPAISGFVGALHALNRRLSNPDIALGGVLIASHDCDVQAYQPHPYADYSFNQSRNPIKKDGKTAAIVEEGKVHLTVSLVVEVLTDSRKTLRVEEAQQAFIQQCREGFMQQRVAGGSVLSVGQVTLFDQESQQTLINTLLPAFVLMDAGDALTELTAKLQSERPEATALDVFVELSTLHHTPQPDGQWLTSSIKSGYGWLVPMPVGYQGITARFDAGVLANCRHQDYPSHYVECLYGLGKWVFPTRLAEHFEHAFWRHSQPQDDVYLISQSPAAH
ncbi:MAG: type I-F CRISPR-associated protein Csy2 [Neisseriaceae bacterium]|nr:type I-F CRISPR-associated protein Csy2 [Neisseriaceae bacterium]